MFQSFLLSAMAPKVEKGKKPFNAGQGLGSIADIWKSTILTNVNSIMEDPVFVSFYIVNTLLIYERDLLSPLGA